MAIRTGEDYINSLRGRKLKVYLFGELIDDYVEHPIIRAQTVRPLIELDASHFFVHREESASRDDDRKGGRSPQVN